MNTQIELSAEPEVLYLVDPRGLHKTAFLEGLAVRDSEDTLRLTLVSRKTQADIVLGELENDDSDFVEGGIDPGTVLADWLDSSADPPRARAAATELGLEPCLTRGLRFLSTGELRKAMIARAVSDGAPVCGLDELLEGVDAKSRNAIPAILALAHPDTRWMIVAELGYTGGLGPADAELIAAKRCIPLRVKELSGADDAEGLDAQPSAPDTLFDDCDDPDRPGSANPIPLIVMKQVQVSWDGIAVLKDFDWLVMPGDHTFIQGPNGCGKSSLLRLITGDNPQVYANHVEICGMRRGMGETIWDVKSRLGYVSHRFHMDYLYHGDYTIAEVVLSGFHDSIGLYESPLRHEQELAELWLSHLGLKGQGKDRFALLDWGHQRMVLVARALVKSPELLLLDEPCQGLDGLSRGVFLQLLEDVSRHHRSTVIHVSHDPGERLGFYRKLLVSEGRGGAWSLSEPEL